MIPPPAVRRYSWEEMEALCERAAAKIRDRGYGGDTIVAILRGGAFPGLLLSHLLRIRRFYAFSVVTTIDNAVRANRVPPQVDLEVPLPISGRHVLLVDDVTNTGETLRAARAVLMKAQPASIIVVSIVWDTAGSNDHACEADLYVDKIDAWAQFPWEQDMPSTSG